MAKKPKHLAKDAGRTSRRDEIYYVEDEDYIEEEEFKEEPAEEEYYDEQEEYYEQPRRAKRRRPFVRFLCWLLAILLIIIAGITAYGFVLLGKLDYIEDTPTGKHEHAADAHSEFGVTNIVLAGMDGRVTVAGARTDTIMLISVNSRTGKVKVTSLLRDIYVDIPGHEGNRLNTAYRFGGSDLLRATIENNFKIKVDGFVGVDFIMFQRAIDAVGGVMVDIQEKEIENLNSNIREINLIDGIAEDTDYITQPGSQLLNGRQALGYVRIRKVGSDFARTQRQRTVLEQVYSRALKMGPIALTGLLEDLLPDVSTDMDKGQIVTLALRVLLAGSDIEMFRLPVDGGYESVSIRGMSVLDLDWEKNRAALRDFIYGKGAEQ